MKLAAIILSAILSIAAKGSYAQNITYSAKNVSLETVFSVIKKQTGYVFFYSYSTLKETKPVTVNVTNASLKTVLDICFADQPVSYLIKDKTIVVSLKTPASLSAQQVISSPIQDTPITIKGRVLYKNGIGIAGASVIVKGTSTGVMTNDLGDFSITLPSKTNVLVISYSGYLTQEVPVNNATEVKVEMEPDIKDLDDIVVIGYGTTRRKNLTGAVSVVDKALLENRPVTNAIAALQGAAPGMVVTRSSGQPGKEGYELNIRGFASLNGTNSPLVIIDGVEGDLSVINPNDIESISVLKDAAAASIYGAKAAGGVVLVTTKKGTASNKINVNYTSLFSLKTRYAVPEVLHSYEQAEMANASLVNAGANKLWSDQQIRWMKDPDTNYIYNPNTFNYEFYDDVNFATIVMRKQTQSSNHNVTISGGSDKAQYMIGLGYYTQNGVFRIGPDNTKRYNARINTNFKLNSIFSLDSRIAYTFSDINSPSKSVNGDNNLLYNIYTLRTLYPVFLPGSDDTKYSSAFNQNTYALLKDGGYNDFGQHSLSGVFTLRAAISKKASLKLIYSPGLVQSNTDIFTRTIQLWNGRTIPVGSINPTNSFSASRVTQYTHNTQALFDYDFKINRNHVFHFLAGAEYKYYNYNFTSAKVNGLSSNDIASLNSYTSSSTYNISDDRQANVWYSGFSRLNYNYKEKYLAELNFRYDVSSRLAPGHRGQLFPAFSVGYNIAKEEWFSAAFPKINELKLRVSWGQLGNAQLGALNERNYDYIAQIIQGDPYPFNGVSTPTYYQRDLPSEGLGWETVESLNGGIDFSILDRRLSGSFDYFIRSNKDMLITVNWPSTLGINPPTTNGAAMRTHGWEAAISWKDKIGKKFSYYINLNVADNKNKITRYDGQNFIAEGVNKAIVGYPINSIFGFIDEGYFSSSDEVQAHAFQDNRNAAGDIKYRDINGDKKIDLGNNTIDNHGDLVYLGNTSPRYQFGGTIGFEWNGIDLSAFVQGIGERKMMPSSAVVVPFAQSWRQPWRVQMDYWTSDNTDAQFPRLYSYGISNVNDKAQLATLFNGRVSTHWVQNSAYIRLKNLQIGYSLPRSVLKRLKLQKVRIFFTGEDLWESTKMWFPYFDPENQWNVGWNYPFFRTYSLGINVSF